MLYIMLAYLMMFTALFNAFFLPLTFANSFFNALYWYIDTVSLFLIIFRIMHSGFYLLVFLILCSQNFFERVMCSLVE